MNIFPARAERQDARQSRRHRQACKRVAEIARMLGGEKVPASAVLHARELLSGAKREAMATRRRAN